MVDLENLNLEYNKLIGVVPGSFTSLFAINPASKVFKINNNNLNRRKDPNHFANLSSALESWFSTLNSTSSRNAQGDITVPIITGTGSITGDMNNGFTYNLGINENSYAVNNALVGMSTTFTGSTLCSSLTSTKVTTNT